jgi:hypothetical protein
MDFRSTIDDEFASLFLQELQGSRALGSTPGTSTASAGIDKKQDEPTRSSTSSTNTNDRHVPEAFMNAASDQGGRNLATASYARYLPLETTYSSGNLFDLNYFEQGDNDFLAGFMEGGTNTEPGVELTNDMNNTMNMNMSLGLPMPVSLGTNMDGGIELESRSNSCVVKLRQELEEPIFMEDIKKGVEKVTVTAQTLTPEPSAADANRPNKIREISTETSDDNDQEEKLNAIAQPVRKVKPVYDENCVDLLQLCDGLLSLTNVDSAEDKLNFIRSSMSGRIYASSDTIDDFKEHSELSDDFELLKMFCYRRNSISVDLNLDFDQILNSLVPDGYFLDSIQLQLFSSLRKLNNKAEVPKLGKCTILTEYEEFVFSGKAASNKKDAVVIGQSKLSLTSTELQSLWAKHGKDLGFSWEQIRFKTATANNRHDVSTKYYIIRFELELRLRNSNNTNIDKTVKTAFESHPFSVRGRNPQFYSGKGEVMIGKLRELSKCHKEHLGKETSPSDKSISEGSHPQKHGQTAAPPPSESSQQTNKQQQQPPITVSTGAATSTYQYFPVDGPYYHAPVEVGYFPHHVHHNKQVFVPTLALTPHKTLQPRQRQRPLAALGGPTHRQYNYFI